MAERTEDEIETRMISRENWLSPVRAAEQLPKVGVAEGSMCYVEGHGPDNDQIWTFRDGRWLRLED